MNIPQVHKLSKASQLSMLAVVILLGAVFFTVNTALKQQNNASNASTGNLLTNPGCENGTSGFYGYQATISTVSNPVYSGNASCKVVSTSGDFYDISSTYSYPNPLQGQTFSGYAYVRAASNTGGKVYLALRERTGSSSSRTTYGPAVSLTTNWQIVTNSMTVQQSGRTSLDYYVVQDPGYSGQEFFVDNMYFTVGSYEVYPPTIEPTKVPTMEPTCAPPPVCYSSGKMICVEPYSGWCGYTPTSNPTKAPTASPTSVVYYPTPTKTYAYPTPTLTYAYPTPTPTYANPTPTPTYANPTPTPMYAYPSPTLTYAYPTPTYAPTSTPVPGDTVLNFTIGLQGIGTAGDAVNPNSTGNMNPLHPTRTVTATVYDAQNQLVATQSGTITFNATTGLFQGSVDIGQGIPTGLYTVKVKADQYLRAIVPGIQTITQGQTNTMPYVSLIVGDITGMNEINITDYNVLMACYSDLEPPQDPTLCGQYTVNGFSMADLNDDGAVNQFDYNLFLRELSNVNGQ